MKMKPPTLIWTDFLFFLREVCGGGIVSVSGGGGAARSNRVGPLANIIISDIAALPTGPGKSPERVGRQRFADGSAEKIGDTLLNIFIRVLGRYSHLELELLVASQDVGADEVEVVLIRSRCGGRLEVELRGGPSGA